jgi:hypothetical protein
MKTSVSENRKTAKLWQKLSHKRDLKIDNYLKNNDSCPKSIIQAIKSLSVSPAHPSGLLIFVLDKGYRLTLHASIAALVTFWTFMTSSLCIPV